MTVVVWIAEGTWPACVDAAATLAPEPAEIVLLHVTDRHVRDAARGAVTGLLGRGRPDPGPSLDRLADTAAGELLTAAAERLGRPARREHRHGRTEHEVVAAAEHAELLVLARDGDRSRLGPHSLGPATRFVVDHAPCPLLLVWPEAAPGLGSIPPPPPRP